MARAEYSARPTGADIALILAATALIAWAIGRYWIPRAQTAASHAIVTVAGQAPQRLPLDAPGTFEFHGARGLSVLQVEDGSVRFMASPCRHKICVQAGALRYAHQATACLPNRMTLTLEGGRSEFDAESY